MSNLMRSMLISSDLLTWQRSASLERASWSSGLSGTSFSCDDCHIISLPGYLGMLFILSWDCFHIIMWWSHLVRATPARVANWRTASPPSPSRSVSSDANNLRFLLLMQIISDFYRVLWIITLHAELIRWVSALPLSDWLWRKRLRFGQVSTVQRILLTLKVKPPVLILSSPSSSWSTH